MWDDDVELSVLVLLPSFLLSFLTCSPGTQSKSRRVKAKTSGSFAGHGGWLPSTLEGKKSNENFSFFLGLWGMHPAGANLQWVPFIFLLCPDFAPKRLLRLKALGHIDRNGRANSLELFSRYLTSPVCSQGLHTESSCPGSHEGLYESHGCVPEGTRPGLQL